MYEALQVELDLVTQSRAEALRKGEPVDTHDIHIRLVLRDMRKYRDTTGRDD